MVKTMQKINVTINGKNIETVPGKTILEVVEENGLDKIPTLCHDKRIEPFSSCFVCVVEVEGLNKLVPSCSTVVNEGMKIITNSQKVKESRKTAFELLFSNHYADCVGPCTNNCPAGVDAQTYIALISMGKYKEALKLVKEKNPLPLSIGRVCVRDCEAACRRKYVDEPVAVNYLKRFIADIDNNNKWVPELKPKKNKKVAIIGGGPAGLTAAYFLTLEGYSTTIFEKLPKLGGMLRYGIPEYRLPKRVLDSEIKWITDLGVEVKSGVEMGVDFCLNDLKNEGFDSIFLGVGAHKASSMRLDKEDITEGVFRGIDFLREVELSFIPELKGIVVIVGGGNTAIDAARTALRCGADKVKIVYRRSLNEMPAHHEEIEAAQKEGCEILFLTNPTAIISENNKLKGIECLQMELVEGKPGERPRPVPVEGSEFIIDCNFLIGAIGQGVDTTFAKKDIDCTLEKWGTIIINDKTMETSIPGVFAGGDVVTGPLTAVSSIAQGKKAADSIMQFLETGEVKKPHKEFVSFRHKLGNLSEREFSHFNKIPRERMEEMSVKERIKCFDEVELGITERQAIEECGRCLECGCSEYYDCTFRKFTEEYDLDISEFTGETRKYMVDQRHPFILLDSNKCINCGRCVRTCAEILKVSALGFVHRGFKSIVKPAMEKALVETNCIACGNCIDTCPTGAISEKFPFKILGTLPKENHETVCSFCSVGCKINYKKVNDEIFYISNSTDEIKDTHNKGYLCIRGRFGHRYLMDQNRTVKPVIRKSGLLHEVDIKDALCYTEKKINELIEKYGPDSVAVFGSSKLSNEELYLLQKFARTGLKNNNIASFANLFYGNELNSLDDSIGLTVSTITMNDMKNADVIVVMNSNLSEENLVMELKLKEAQKNGAKLVVINSSEIKLTRFADLWVDSKKGTNTLLMNSLMKSCIDNGKIDNQFIQNKTEKFDEFRERIENLNIPDALELINLNENKLRELSELVSNPESNVVFIYNIDSTREKSVNDLKSIGNFLMMTGRIDKQNNGIIVLRENNNSAGLFDMGVSPNYLPGYVKFSESGEVDRIGNSWKVDLKTIFKENDLKSKMKRGEIKGALIFGEDPLAIKENRKYFSSVEFLLVSDSFNTTSVQEADVVLPALTHIEQEGTYTNCDHTLQRGNRIIEGCDKLPNWDVIQQLGARFGMKSCYQSSDEIFEEIRSINRYYNKAELEKSWIDGLFTNGYFKSKIPFALYSVEFDTFTPVKPVMHYSEAYYTNNIKMRLS